MLVPVTAKAALLQSLCSGTESFGVELIACVRASTRGKICLNDGSVYPALHALEEDGLVSSRVDGAPVHGGRPRRYYKITSKGRKEASAARDSVGRLFGFVSREGS